MTRRMLLLFAVVALLVIGTSWLSRKSVAPSPKSAATSHQPDYFINGLDSTVTDEHGNPSYRLRAESLIHYPDNDTTELTQPDITVLGRQNEARWHATAATGKVESRQKQMLLHGNVTLKQSGSNKLELHTEWLQIDTARHYAETGAPVTLLASGTTLEGIGMRAYGDEQRLQLLSSVRGKYAAQ